jgi:tetratricopeptide (TPR) repeat protein
MNHAALLRPAFVGIVVLVAPTICAAQSDRARQWFNQAIEATDTQEKLRCVNNAIEADESLWQAWAFRGEIRLNLNQLEEAEADAYRAATLAPGEIIAWSVLTRARLANGKHQECVTTATQALEHFGQQSPLSSKVALLYVFRAEAHRALTQEAASLEDLNRALEKDPQCVLALGARVNLLFAMGRMDEARTDCDRLERLVQRRPDDLDLRMTLGQAQFMVDRYTEAIETANFVLARKENFAPAFILRGKSRRFMRELHAALEDMEKAVQADPSNLDARFEQGMICAQLGRLDQAESHLGMVLGRVPGHVPTRTLLAQVQLNRKNWDGVIEEANRILNVAKDDKAKATAWCLGAVALRSMGKNQNAIECLDKALNLNPRLADAFFERALAHSNLGNLVAAIADCDNGVRIDPKSTLGYLVRGRAHARVVGNESKAVADLNRVLKLAPQSHYAVWSYVSLASLAREKEDHDQAIAWATRGIEMPVDYRTQPEYMDPISIAYVLRAFSRRVQGKREEAIEDCTRAIKMDEKYAGAYVERAVCLRVLHRYDRALEDCNQSIHLEPYHLRAYLERGFASLEKYRGEGVGLAGTAADLPPILRDMTGRMESPAHIGKTSIVDLQNKDTTSDAPRIRPYVPEPVKRPAVNRERHPLDQAVEDFAMSLRAGYEVLASARGLAQCLAEQGRLEEAKQTCDSALAQTSSDAGKAELYLVRAAIEYALGSVEEGLANARASAKLKKTMAEAPLLEAYGYALDGQWKRCEDTCCGAISLDAEPHVAARLLLVCYTARAHGGDLERATQLLAREVKQRSIALQQWPGPIVRALIENQQFQQFAAALAAESQEHVKRRRFCEALYYFGVGDYAAGQLGQAKAKWSQARDQGMKHHIEFALTDRELQRLGF